MINKIPTDYTNHIIHILKTLNYEIIITEFPFQTAFNLFRKNSYIGYVWKGYHYLSLTINGQSIFNIPITNLEEFHKKMKNYDK